MNVNANRNTALKLLTASIVMFGFGYVLVPLYDVLCEITGLNGKTGRIADVQAQQVTVDTSRLVTVEFDTNVNSELAWEFRPLDRKMQIHPGEVYETIFYVKNTTDVYMVGQAIPSVVPFNGSRFFNKTQCFCFSKQPLAPGESKEMPVRFIVDPAMPGSISTLTLSYTFFPLPDAVIGVNDPQPETEPKS